MTSLTTIVLVLFYHWATIVDGNFNTTIKLLSLEVPDGKLLSGRPCFNDKCSLWMSVCIDSLDSNYLPNMCSQHWWALGRLTEEENMFQFENNKTYGQWHNPRLIEVPSYNNSGYLMKFNIRQSPGQLPVARFNVPVTFDNDTTITFNHTRGISVSFSWEKPHLKPIGRPHKPPSNETASETTAAGGQPNKATTVGGQPNPATTAAPLAVGRGAKVTTAKPKQRRRFKTKF